MLEIILWKFHDGNHIACRVIKKATVRLASHHDDEVFRVSKDSASNESIAGWNLKGHFDGR
jgi:hypothetical protein